MTYSWNGGVTDGVPYTLAGTGTHIVYGTDANGCWDSASVTVYVNNLPDVSTTSMGASISAVNQTGATYQWIDCDNNFAMITGEINPSYTAGANGDYSVVISSLGCVDTSSCVNIFSVGAAQNELENNISIYPNPAISEFTIEYKESIIKNHDVTIEVYDMSGKLVKSEQRIVNSGISYFKTNIEEFKNGIYFVRLLDDDSKVLYSQTVIKQ